MDSSRDRRRSMNSKLCSATPRSRWIRRTLAGLAVGALVPIFASQDVASAQPKTAAPTPAPTAAAAPRPEDKQPQRDPKAIAALEKMGAYLKTLPSFGVRS